MSWTALALLLVAGALLTGWNLQIQTVANPDEPRYAVPARIMADGGDWVVPEFNGRPRLQKPAFFYWLIAATGTAGRALGLEITTGLRLGPLLMGLLAAAGIFVLGTRLRNLRTGIMAAGILITTRYFHEISRDLVVDMTLTTACLWTWIFALIAIRRLREERSAFAPLFGAYGCLAIATLTKGPVLAGLFAMLPVLVYLWWSGELRLLKRGGLWWGLPLMVAPSVAWTVALWQRGYHAEVKGYYLMENASRAVGARDHQELAPYLFYFRSLGENYLPWILLMPFALWWVVRLLRREPADEDSAPPPALRMAPDSTRVLVCGLVVPFVILGLSLSKRSLYLLPLYPWISLWLAWFWDEHVLSREGQPSVWLRNTLIAFGAGLIVATFLLPYAANRMNVPPSELQPLFLFGFGIFAALNLAALCMHMGLRFSASLLLLWGAGTLWLAREVVVRPIDERQEDRVAFFQAIEEKLNGRPLVMLGESSNEAVWFLDRRGETLDDVRYPDLKDEFFGKPGAVLLITERELAKTPKLADVLTIEHTILRGGQQKYLMTVHTRGTTPDPSVFEPKRRVPPKNSDD